MLAGVLAVIFVTFQCMAAHLRPIYEMSKLGLWFEKDTGAFLVALKNTESNTVTLFGFDGSVRPANDCTKASEVDFKWPMSEDNIEAILTILKPHNNLIDWNSFFPIVLSSDTSVLKHLPQEFWSAIGSSGCITLLTRLPTRAEIIEMIYHLDKIGVDTDQFCLKAGITGKAHGPAGELRRTPSQVLFFIRQPSRLISHWMDEPLFLHTKLFDDLEDVEKDQPLYLYQK